MEEYFDVVVIGAGHAGVEAAYAAARLGANVALVTLSVEAVARMSCNPCIGGMAKGHLVREIDALGGIMAKAADETGIQFRRLGTKKGHAVRSRRCQSDMAEYSGFMRRFVERDPRIHLRQDNVIEILVKDGRAYGCLGLSGRRYIGQATVLTAGTFLRGLLHIGMTHFAGGRLGEGPSNALSENLMKLGLPLGRLKTGTPARLDSETIDYNELEIQLGDEKPAFFSFETGGVEVDQIPCHITYTNEQTHEIIRGGLDRSPLYAGKIEGVGARYCPSVEDKIVRFPEKTQHQIFLEPVGRDSTESYPNGISTSLPFDVQLAMIHSIRGLERAEVIRPGYAIEYDFMNPVHLHPSLEVRKITHLFFAGQVNGTSGYEEAAAQGLIAAVNAVHRIRDLEPVILRRDEAMIGVLVDDLVTKGTDEPYRMFTSRAEYRLLLREDNADLRLTPLGEQIGLVSDERARRTAAKNRDISSEFDRLDGVTVTPTEAVLEYLRGRGSAAIQNKTSLAKLLRRPELSYEDLDDLDPQRPSLDADVIEQIEIQIQYFGYIERQNEEARRLREADAIQIPPNISYRKLAGLSTEVAEKLDVVQPRTIGQAGRIPGVTPAALQILMVHAHRQAQGDRADHSEK
ncbi:MAG: tRNA uridine-5-carboxymethylaminomethyl(34) synthesis enzyme MnmG [Candidatus Lernaella stagnicola]|nr:tRNA uridine-5-carboxymethylaminomethyl(34) synthesis enzyme MnmG [Candidatus Lernaella stagnicola]